MEIKQYYLGDGKSLDYRFELFEDGIMRAELENVPHEVNIGSVLKIHDKLYVVETVFDCDESDESLEVVWYKLKPFKEEFEILLKSTSSRK